MAAKKKPMPMNGKGNKQLPPWLAKKDTVSPVTDKTKTPNKASKKTSRGK